jgi:hypothetical protein
MDAGARSCVRIAGLGRFVGTELVNVFVLVCRTSRSFLSAVHNFSLETPEEFAALQFDEFRLDQSKRAALKETKTYPQGDKAAQILSVEVIKLDEVRNDRRRHLQHHG